MPAGKQMMSIRQLPARLTNDTQHGYAVVLMLMLVAVFGLALAAVGETNALTSARRREAALLLAGQDVVAAIRSYHSLHGRYPANWNALLEDRANGLLKRHLRRIPRDPMTGQADWLQIQNAAGDFIGVRSRSVTHPIKSTPVVIGTLTLPPVESYDQWRFTCTPLPARP